jgi:DNA-binding NarL/FixJ family response regulator
VSSIKIMLVDDEDVVRRGFRSVLDEDDEFELVAEVSGGPGVVQLADRLRPDVVLIDVHSAGGDGMGLIRTLRAERARRHAVVVLTSCDQDECLFRVLEAGAAGFLQKDSPMSEILCGVRAVAKGEAMISPRMTRKLIDNFEILPPSRREFHSQVLSALSDRELQVLRGVALGKSNQEIARELQVSNGTVKSHVSHVLTKLNLRDRVQAALLARDSNLIGIAPHRR